MGGSVGLQILKLAGTGRGGEARCCTLDDSGEFREWRYAGGREGGRFVLLRCVACIAFCSALLSLRYYSSRGSLRILSAVVYDCGGAKE